MIYLKKKKPFFLVTDGGQSDSPEGKVLANSGPDSYPQYPISLFGHLSTASINLWV